MEVQAIPTTAANIGTVPLPPIYIDDAPPAPRSSISALTENPFTATLRNAYTSFQDRRALLGLSNPGSVEGVAREVQREVLLTNLMFSGFRADITRAHSGTPLFHTAHNFTMGAQGLPPYTFAALYGSSNVFLQGNVDHDLGLTARANYRWSPAFVTKTNVQIAPPGAGQSMMQLEADYQGDDFTANIKSVNPSILDGTMTGIFIGSYLQSVTPRLALGLEAMWQRAAGSEGPQSVTAYAARYKGTDWILSGQLLAQGGIQTSFWKRLSDKVEAGIDLNLQFLGLSGASPMMMGMPENDGTATLGAKYEFRMATFRGQVDSKGKVSCLLERRVSPPVMVTFAGELDHTKNTARVGLAVSLESAAEELMEQQQSAMDAPPPPPF